MMLALGFEYVACVGLLLCFAVFSIASFRHFDPRSKSMGNLTIRALTLAGTAMNTILAWGAAPIPTGMSILAIVLSGIALVVFRAALSSAPKGSLHVVFTGSGPEKLVTSGVYGRIRNPLYTSYLAYWAGWVAVTALHPISIACFALFCVAYWIAVIQEERFLTDQFGSHYLAFKSRTGRFLPRVSVLRS